MPSLLLPQDVRVMSGICRAQENENAGISLRVNKGLCGCLERKENQGAGGARCLTKMPAKTNGDAASEQSPKQACPAVSHGERTVAPNADFPKINIVAQLDRLNAGSLNVT